MISYIIQIDLENITTVGVTTRYLTLHEIFVSKDLIKVDNEIQ